MGPESEDDVEALGEDLAALLRINADHLELPRLIAAARPEVEATAA